MIDQIIVGEILHLGVLGGEKIESIFQLLEVGTKLFQAVQDMLDYETQAT